MAASAKTANDLPLLGAQRPEKTTSAALDHACRREVTVIAPDRHSAIAASDR
jgi:hypothetical protein